MKLRKRTKILLLIAVGILLYLNVIHNDFILGDDEDQILNNIQVHSVSNMPQFFFESTYYNAQANHSYGLFYRPLMLTTYSLLYTIDGPNPTIFHFSQLILHIANTIIVFLILASFFPESLSFFLALLFLVHPINSETVIHSANLQDVLFFFFGGLALFSIINNKGKPLQKKTIAIFTTCLLLSLFSKETGVAFGLLTLFYLFLFDKKKLWKFLYSFFTVSFVYITFRFLIAKVGFEESAISPIAHASFFIRMLTIPSIIFTYIITFFLPINLQTAQLWITQNASITGFFFPLTVVILLAVFILLAEKAIVKSNKKNISLYRFFTCWFLLGLVLHLQIVPLDVTVADRWFYFPIVGLLGVFGTLYNTFFYKNQLANKIGLIVYLIILILFSIRTSSRILDWKDSQTLFIHELQISPHNFLIENNLGDLYIQNGDYQKAKPYIIDSVRQYPYLGNLNNMAILLTHDNNINEANKYFTLALQRGGSYTVYKNYAFFLLLYAKDYKKTRYITSKGIEAYPKGNELYLTRALAEYQTGDFQNARKDAMYANTLFPSKRSQKIYNEINTKQKLLLEKLFNFTINFNLDSSVLILYA